MLYQMDLTAWGLAFIWVRLWLTSIVMRQRKFSNLFAKEKINYTDILLKKIDFVVDNNDTLDRYLRGIKGSEGFPGCYHYVDTSGTFRKYTDRVVIHPENEEDFGYRFRVNPDGSMYIARFDIEEGLIVDKKDMVNIYSNLFSDLLHHVFSRKNIYA